jgi:putative membrane protein
MRAGSGLAAEVGMRRWPSHERYFLTLSGLFLLVFTLLAIHPSDRSDWALENALLVPAVAFLVATRRSLPFSRISYTLIFLFLCLHEVGSHYTYAAVPYDRWFEGLTGRTFGSLVGWERNNFDRVVHFAFGLLLAYPIREIFVRVARSKGFWGYYLPLDVTMAFSMAYELIEWAAAEIFGGDLGVAYLGTQGDVWDAHKDMLLATVGAVAAMAVTAAINARLQRDFAREWADSVRVKVRRPLGEDEIQRMLAEDRRKR